MVARVAAARVEAVMGAVTAASMAVVIEAVAKPAVARAVVREGSGACAIGGESRHENVERHEQPAATDAAARGENACDDDEHDGHPVETVQRHELLVLAQTLAFLVAHRLPVASRGALCVRGGLVGDGRVVR